MIAAFIAIAAIVVVIGACAALLAAQLQIASAVIDGEDWQ